MAHLGANLCREHLSHCRMPHDRRGSVTPFWGFALLDCNYVLFPYGRLPVGSKYRHCKKRLITSSALIPISGNKLYVVKLRVFWLLTSCGALFTASLS